MLMDSVWVYLKADLSCHTAHFRVPLKLQV